MFNVPHYVVVILFDLEKHQWRISFIIKLQTISLFPAILLAFQLQETNQIPGNDDLNSSFNKILNLTYAFL